MHKSIALIGLLLLLGCKEKVTPRIPDKDELIEWNRVAVKKEAAQIDRFVEAQSWPTVKTGSGLHYYVYQKGGKDSIRSEDRIEVEMVVTLLNGDTCYSYKKYGSEIFVVDHDHHESGLHEAVKKMCVGNKAKVVLPSYLAFGVAGDFNKIPLRSSVVYDIHILGKK